MAYFTCACFVFVFSHQRALHNSSFTDALLGTHTAPSATFVWAPADGSAVPADQTPTEIGRGILRHITEQANVAVFRGRCLVHEGAIANAVRPDTEGGSFCYAEDQALGGTVSAFVTLHGITRGDVVRVTSSMDPWVVLHRGDGVLGQLSDACGRVGARLQIVSARGSDTDMDAAAAQEEVYAGKHHVCVVRIEGLLDGEGGPRVVYHVRDGKCLLREHAAATSPELFAHATAKQLDDVPGLCAVWNRVNGGTASSLSACTTNEVTAAHRVLTNKFPLLLKSLEPGGLTLTQYEELHDAMPSWDTAPGGLDGAISGANYILIYSEEGVTVQELLTELLSDDSYKVPRGMSTLIESLKAAVGRGHGDRRVVAVNTGETGRNPKRPRYHVLDEEDGNALPRAVGRAFNRIKHGSVGEHCIRVGWRSDEDDAAVAADAVAGARRRMINEALYGAYLLTQQAPGDEAQPQEGRPDVFAVALNFASPGPSQGNPLVQASRLASGAQGDMALRDLRCFPHNLVGVEFLIEALVGNGDHVREGVLGMTARAAYSEMCSYNGAPCRLYRFYFILFYLRRV
jgi:hypothetical protein